MMLCIARRIVVLILLLIFSITVLILSSSCDEGCGDPEICFTMKPESCPNQNLSGSLFHLSELREEKKYMNTSTGEVQDFPDVNHPFEFYQPKGGVIHSTNAVVDNSNTTSRYVEGYEIN